MNKPHFVLIVLLAMVPPMAAEAGDRQVRVTLELRTGNQVTGLALEHDDHRIVLKTGGQLMAFPWDDVQTPSAYQAR